MVDQDSNTKSEKVMQLYVELLDTKQRKKDTAKGFNEEIKRIQDEIEDLLEEDRTTLPTND